MCVFSCLALLTVAVFALAPGSTLNTNPIDPGARLSIRLIDACVTGQDGRRLCDSPVFLRKVKKSAH